MLAHNIYGQAKEVGHDSWVQAWSHVQYFATNSRISYCYQYYFIIILMLITNKKNY